MSADGEEVGQAGPVLPSAFNLFLIFIHFEFSSFEDVVQAPG